MKKQLKSDPKPATEASVNTKAGDLKPSKDASSLSDLKEIGCKSAWTIHIPPLSRAIEELLPFKIDEIWLRPVRFSLRFFKSDRLLGVASVCYCLRCRKFARPAAKKPRHAAIVPHSFLSTP